MGPSTADYFDRTGVYGRMPEWKNTWAPDYALFLCDARGVGKTTLAEKLGREQYRSYIIVRFDDIEPEVRGLFVSSLRDLDTLFSTLEFVYQTKLYKRESLIVLDEIQLFPPARQALKTLLEDGRYDYLETGSLATFDKRTKDILIPSEEYRMDVLPMDFGEYLNATGRSMVTQAICEHFESLRPMGELHQEAMKAYQEWMLVGGMPQAVRVFVDTRDFERADTVKRQILDWYVGDMEVQNKERVEYLKGFFEHIPSELSKRDKRYVISHVDKGARMREYRGSICWLDRAMIVNLAHNVDDPGTLIPSIGDTSNKCYLMDAGLLVSLARRNGPYLENDLYRAILSRNLQVRENMVTENAIAQSLRASGHPVFCFRESDEKTHKVTLQVDFLVRHNNKVCPLVINSAGARGVRSLAKFRAKFKGRVG